MTRKKIMHFNTLWTEEKLYVVLHVVFFFALFFYIINAKTLT